VKPSESNQLAICDWDITFMYLDQRDEDGKKPQDMDDENERFQFG